MVWIGNSALRGCQRDALIIHIWEIYPLSRLKKKKALPLTERQGLKRREARHSYIAKSPPTSLETLSSL